MDLHSGNLYWPETCPRPRLQRSSPSVLHVDVLIVGAGVTGALTADAMTRRGLKVAVVDSRHTGEGSTQASTALLQYELDTPLYKLAKMLEPSHANEAYLASYRALSDMTTLCEGLGDVELITRMSLQIATSSDEIKDLNREADARREIGISVIMLDSKELVSRFGLVRPAALLSQKALQLNPLKLTYALLQRAVDAGATLLRRHRVDLTNLAAFPDDPKVVRVGPTEVHADTIVLATGYETPNQFEAVAKLTELRSTYAIVTRPLSNDAESHSSGHGRWMEQCLLWETGDPYLYVRTTPDGRIIAGGEDEPFSSAARRDRLIAQKAEVLVEKLREFVPGAAVEYAWGGTFARTKDGLPYIGSHPRYPGVHFALGYGGNGITFGLLAAQIFAAALSGGTHEATDLFRFGRHDESGSDGV